MADADNTTTESNQAAPGPDLSKLTKAELIAELNAVLERAHDLEAARELSHWRLGPEATAFAISALLDLHRTAGTAQGSTIRGKKADGSAPRYLEAAKVLGERLCDEVLGSEGAVAF